MELTVHEEQARVPVTVFAVKGDIDIISSPELLSQARAAFTGGMRNLILDLSQVGYISSAGVRALHQVFLLLRTDDPEESEASMMEGMRAGSYVSPHLKLVNPMPRAEEALKNTGLDMYLSIYPTVDAALAAYA